MLKIVLLALCAIGTVLAEGELIILHSPNNVKFQGSQSINQSFLKEVFSTVLGYSAKLTQPWDALTIDGPFDLPEAVVSIAIEGVESIHSTKGIHYPLNVDEVEETTWQAVSRRLEERDNNNTLVRICVGDGLDALGQSALGELKPSPIDESSLKKLDLKNDEDRKFLEELQLLRAIAQKIPTTITANSKSDVYWFVVSGLRPVLDLHGKDSEASQEALRLLNAALDNVVKAFNNVYDGKVVVAVYTNDANKIRNTRSIESGRVERQADAGKPEAEVVEENPETTEGVTTDKYPDISAQEKEQISEGIENIFEREFPQLLEPSTTPDNQEEEDSDTEIATERTPESHSQTSENEIITGQPPKNLKFAKKYSQNYPIIFNILLWFGIIFFFSLLAICIAISEMDPGRDSIIYRMTSNRMKKDN